MKIHILKIISFIFLLSAFSLQLSAHKNTVYGNPVELTSKTNDTTTIYLKTATKDIEGIMWNAGGGKIEFRIPADGVFVRNDSIFFRNITGDTSFMGVKVDTFYHEPLYLGNGFKDHFLYDGHYRDTANVDSAWVIGIFNSLPGDPNPDTTANTQWAAEKILYDDYSGTEGSYYLIWNEVAGTQFLTHEQQIMHIVGGIPNYQDATVGDLITIAHDSAATALYQLTDTGWRFIQRYIPWGLSYPTVAEDVGTGNSKPFRIFTKAKKRIEVKGNGDFYNYALKNTTGKPVHASYDAAGKEFLVQDTALSAIDPVDINDTGAVYLRQTFLDSIRNGDFGGSGGGGAVGISQLGSPTYGLIRVNDSTYKADSATLSNYYVRHKDSSVAGGYYPYSTNPKNYLTSYTETDPLSVHVSDSAAMLSPYLRSNIAAATYTPLTRNINTGYGLSGGSNLSADRTIIADSATLSNYYVRHKDSSVAGGYYPYSTNPKNYLTSYTETDPLSVHIADSAAMLSPYFRTIAFNSTFDTRFATKTTDDLTEGSTNKYYTDARARAALSLTTTGSGAATYNNSTGVLNVPTPAGGTTPDTLRDSKNPITIFNQTYFSGTTNFNVTSAPTVAYTNGAIRLSSALNVGFTKYWSVAGLTTNDDQTVKNLVFKVDSLGTMWMSALSVNSWSGQKQSIYAKLSTTANTLAYYYPDTSTLISTTNLDYTIALNDVLQFTIQQSGKGSSIIATDITQKTTAAKNYTVVESPYFPNSNDFAFGCSQGVIEVQQVNITSYAIKDAYVTFWGTSKAVTTGTPIQYPRAAALGSTNIMAGNSDGDTELLQDTNYARKLGGVYAVIEANRNDQARGLSAQQCTTNDSLLAEALKRIYVAASPVKHLLPQSENTGAGGQNQTALATNINTKYASGDIIDPNTNITVANDLADGIHANIYGAGKWSDNIHNSGKIPVRNESSYNNNQTLAQRIVNSQWTRSTTGGKLYPTTLTDTLSIGSTTPTRRFYVNTGSSNGYARIESNVGGGGTSGWEMLSQNQYGAIFKTTIAIAGTGIGANDLGIYNDNIGDISLWTAGSTKGIGLYGGGHNQPDLYAMGNDVVLIGLNKTDPGVGGKLNVGGPIYTNKYYAIGNSVFTTSNNPIGNPAGSYAFNSTSNLTETMDVASNNKYARITFTNINTGLGILAGLAAGQPTICYPGGSITIQSLNISGTYSWYVIDYTIGTSLTPRVTTQFDAVSTTTLADITGLTTKVAAGISYKFEAVLYTTSNVAGGVKVATGGTATATSIIYEAETWQSGVPVATGTQRATALATAVGDVTAVTTAKIVINGTITVNAAGTLTIGFAQNASNGSASSVLVGSTFTVTQIP